MMIPRHGQTIRSLERGLSVVAAINKLAPAGLSRLVDVTGLPKATVVRVLNTLRAAGYVELAENAGYRLLPRARELCSSVDRDSGPTPVIRRLLNEFAAVVKWPAEVLACEGATMVIEISNRESAPITLRQFEHIRFPLLNSASGIALLAWSKPMHREQLIKHALMQTKSLDRPYVEKAVRKEILTSIERGYAQRDYETPIEGTRAVSIPLIRNGVAREALALIYLRDVVVQSQVDSFFLPQLRTLAQQIARIRSEQENAR